MKRVHLAALSVGLAIGVAMAMPRGLTAQELIHACVDQRSGDLRVIASGGQCKKGESPLEWNIQGLPGAEGPQGPIGPLGPVGPIGPRGVDGPTGSPGPAGPQGVVGPAGATGARGLEGPTGPIGPSGVEGPQGRPGVGLLTVVGANGLPAGQWVEYDTMRVPHPSGRWLYLNLNQADLIREENFEIVYSEPDCTGTEYTQDRIRYTALGPPLSFINVGYVVDDRVFIRTGVVDSEILLRSDKAWRPSQSGHEWICLPLYSLYGERTAVRRLDSFPLSDLNLPLGPYHLEGQD